MKEVIKSYTFPILQLIGVVGISICSLWYSGWYGQGERDYVTYWNSNLSPKAKPITTASFWDVTQHNAFEFSKPVPYTAFSIIIGLFGGLGSLRNQHKMNSLSELNKQYDVVNGQLRSEKNDHAETQKNYYEAIGYIIRSIFVSTDDDFDKNCRVTIYRHTNDSQLKRIYRHAGQTRFEHGGRLKIPDNEGVVGAAWLNDGIAHISIDTKFGTQTYRQQLEKELKQHGAVSSNLKTRMPTRDYFAMAVRGDDRTKVAVIVLESTEPNTFKRERLETIISQENGDIAKYIIHKGKLDEILNPDGDLEHG
ncbi:hypothetical protein AB3A37_004093 [Vibrio alginolyticus]